MQTMNDFATAVAGAVQFHFLRYGRSWITAVICILLVALGVRILVSAPADFPVGATIVIAQGTSGEAAAEELLEAHIIKYPRLFRLQLRLEEAQIHAGAYRFATPQNQFTIAYRLIKGLFGIPPIHITFIEGTTVRDMATKVAEDFPEISAEDFISAAQPYEGYLFPDTYIFQPDATANTIVTAMQANFTAKLAPLQSAILASGHSLSDIIIMASLIEKEARTSADRREVSGILWNRIKLNMPLQVDAVFGYIYGRETYSPSFADLTIDSPYNTYKYKGLPPGPIDSPSLDSIEAAIMPDKTPYLYYLTGKDGLMYYATTYAEQLVNEEKYLR